MESAGHSQEGTQRALAGRPSSHTGASHSSKTGSHSDGSLQGRKGREGLTCPHTHTHTQPGALLLLCWSGSRLEEGSPQEASSPQPTPRVATPQLFPQKPRFLFPSEENLRRATGPAIHRPSVFASVQPTARAWVPVREAGGAGQPASPQSPRSSGMKGQRKNSEFQAQTSRELEAQPPGPRMAAPAPGSF